MSSPENILWKKEQSQNSELFLDIFANENFNINLSKVTFEYELHKFNYKFPKSDSLARRYREKGKEFFEDGDYLMALTTYNLGLAMAESNSAEKGMAYANRSMCFLKMNMPEKCLIDIEFAKQFNYPSHLMQKLEARTAKCNALLADETFKSKIYNLEEPTLSFKQHNRFVGVADCLEIRNDDRFGYHVITTCDLNVGETILVEPSYAITPKRNVNIGRDRCWNCFKDLQNYITCEKSIGNLYCNEDCMQKSFHRYECDLPTLTRKETSDLVFKVLYKLIVDFPHIGDLMKMVDKLLKDEEVTGLTRAQEDFCSIFRLFHKHKLSESQQSTLPRQSAIIFVQLMEIDEFKEIFRAKEHQRFLQHLILHLLHVTEHAFDLHEFKPEHSDDGDEPVMAGTFLHYASAIYPFASYIKHSCAPNVFWFAIDDRLICKVIRPIAKGEQVLRSYL